MRQGHGKRTFAFSRLASRSGGGNISFARLIGRGRIAYLEGAQQALVHAHHRTGVVKLSAVVWCTEQRNQLPLREELVTVLDDLMSAANQVHIVLLKEPGDNVWAEREGDTTIVLGPSGNILVWVRPQQVAKQTAVWDL